MSMARSRVGVRALLTTFALIAVTSADAWAQAATITGRVTNEAGTPINGANVIIEALNAGTTSGANGSYTLTIPAAQATGQTVSISSRFIGFAPLSRSIRLTPGPQTQDFQLKADPFRLEEMIVTGVAEATSAKKLAFSVGRVSEEQLKDVPASSPVAALAGKVSGVRVAAGTGNPGSAPTIRLRGSTSLTVGASSPLVIVDGVITQNSISDIDANDIASVEVLKGAAASAFYGSDAANGVVNITTKRGQNVPDNSVQFTVRGEYGQSGLNNFVPLNEHHQYKLNADGTIETTAAGARVPTAEGVANNPFPSTGPNRFRNQLETWLNDGTFYSTNVQLGLRRGSTNLHSSYTMDHNQGVLPLTSGQYRRTFRLNVDQGIGSKADLSMSVSYGLNNNDYDPDGSGSWFALLQTPPTIDLRQPNGNDTIPFFPDLPADLDPSDRNNPLYSLANQDYTLRRERMLGSAVARYRPFDWLRLEASYGTDRLNRRERTYNFRGYLTSGGTPGNGSLAYETDNNVSQNTQLNATASKMFFDQLLSTTRLAYLVEQQENTGIDASGSKLVVNAVPDLGAVDPTQSSINSTITDQRTIDYFVAQSFDLRDRYIVDLLWRRDGSSLFGPNERWQNFYRVAGAYRLSEDFSIPGVQELKLRAARGTAGLRPRFADQYETYDLDNGQFSKEQLGNKDLKPAIQTENEFGVNVQFLDRFDLEVVRANRLTEGAFLAVPLVSAQSGGFESQIQNAADVESKTTELSLNTRVYESPDFSYNFTITGDHTTQRITKMDRAPFRVNAGGQGQDVFYYKSGEPLGIIYGAKWVHSFEELKQNPDNASAVESDYVVNPLGFLVKSSLRGTKNEMPIRYVESANGTKVDQFQIGDVNPDFSFGFANNLRYKGLNFYVLFDGVQGGDIYNFTKQWMFQDERHGDIDQFGKADPVPVAFFSAGLYNGLVGSEYFVEDGSYVKLREVSLGYSLTPAMMQKLSLDRLARGAKLSLIGRNLYTWTSYSGFDPEVTSGNDFNFKIDGFRYPQFRTITAQVELSF